MNADEALLMADELPACIETGKGHLTAVWVLAVEVRRQHALIESLRVALQHAAADNVVRNSGATP